MAHKLCQTSFKIIDMFNKTYSIAILFFIGIGVAFLIVSFLLKFNANNHKLIKRKLNLGAAMLTISAIMYGCGQKNTEEISCYAATVIDDSSNTEIKEEIANKNDSLYKKFVINAVKDLKLNNPNNNINKCYVAIDVEPIVSCYDVAADPPIDSVVITPPDEPEISCYLLMPSPEIDDTL